MCIYLKKMRREVRVEIETSKEDREDLVAPADPQCNLVWSIVPSSELPSSRETKNDWRESSGVL